MRDHDEMHEELLADLAALDDFFQRRGGAAADVPVGRDDPDLRRLMEAVAFFSARTRRIAREEARAAVARICRGHLAPLLAPLPAAGLVQALPGPGAEPAELPQGAELRLAAPDGAEAAFTLSRPLSVRPLRLSGAELAARSGGLRLTLRLEASAPQRGSLGALRLHVSRLGEYAGSLRLLRLIQEHHRRAAVRYDEEGAGGAPVEQPCALAFGVRGAAEIPSTDDDLTHPLERVRRFFHQPEDELFLEVLAPERDRPWRRAAIAIDLDGEAPWPEDLAPAGPALAAAFRLFVAPVRNLRRAPAAAILCDGTRDAYSIRPDREEGLCLHAVRGVYRVEGDHRIPLRPAWLAEGEGTYHVEGEGGGLEDAPLLFVRAAEAFARPFRIAVDALWSQPGFDARAPGRLAASLRHRQLPGVAFQVLGDLRARRPSPLRGDGPGQLDVFALRGRALERDDLARLLGAAGVAEHPAYAPLAAAIAHLAARHAPGISPPGAALRRVYALTLSPAAPSDPALRAAFAEQVLALLDAWTAEPAELELSGPDGIAGRRFVA